MSYILDALKKAAEQRDAHAPAMRRLFSPAPEFSESPRWRMALVGGAAALAGAIIAVWVLWPARTVVTERPAPLTTADRPAPTPPAVARVQRETAPVQPDAPAQPPPPPPPAARTTPKPAPSVKVAPEKRPAPAAPLAAQPRPAPSESVTPPAPPTPPAAESAPARPQLTVAPPSPAAPRPAPAPAVAAPAPASTRGDQSGMRLEVIVYSDERTRRLAFINGRKYVEGDTLLDGSRIQEIQPNAVVIVDEGRRVVLKP